MKSIVLFSGGIDSTTALAIAIGNHPENVVALTIRYGSKHMTSEGAAAEAIIEHYGCVYEIIDLPSGIFEGADSALMGDAPMPHVDYQDVVAEGPSATVVPFRNAVFLSIATAAALRWSASQVWLATHMADYAQWAYPDCSPEFVGSMAAAIYVGTMHEVRLVTPFSWLTKGAVVGMALQAGVPIDLTWSCYQGGSKHCGVCPTCRERIAAFLTAGCKDPVPYEIEPTWPAELIDWSLE